MLQVPRRLLEMRSPREGRGWGLRDRCTRLWDRDPASASVGMPTCYQGPQAMDVCLPQIHSPFHPLGSPAFRDGPWCPQFGPDLWGWGEGGEQGGTLLADPFPGLTAPPAVSPGHLCGSSGLGRLCHLVICRQRQPHRLPGFHQPGLPGNFRTARGQPEASADRGGVYSWTRVWGAVLAAPPPCLPHPLVCLQRVSQRLLSSDPQPPHGAVRERQGRRLLPDAGGASGREIGHSLGLLEPGDAPRGTLGAPSSVVGQAEWDGGVWLREIPG